MFASRLKMCVCAFCIASPLSYADELKIPERLRDSQKIVYCSSLDSPPIGFIDKSTSKPNGLVVDIGNVIGQRLNKQVEWRVMPFSGIIPALLARQCDLVLTHLFDKPERRKIIDMVDYTKSSQTIVVTKGNPHSIRKLEDLSDQKVAVLNGSTIKSLLDKENEKFTAANIKPMKLVVFNSDSDAFQSLRVGQVAAYGTTSEFSIYYQNLAPGLFEDAVPAFAEIMAGIGIRKDDRELGQAVDSIVKSIRADGTYQTIFKKWNLEKDMLKEGEGHPLSADYAQE